MPTPPSAIPRESPVASGLRITELAARRFTLAPSAIGFSFCLRMSSRISFRRSLKARKPLSSGVRFSQNTFYGFAIGVESGVWQKRCFDSRQPSLHYTSNSWITYHDIASRRPSERQPRPTLVSLAKLYPAGTCRTTAWSIRGRGIEPSENLHAPGASAGTPRLRAPCSSPARLGDIPQPHPND